MLLHNVGENITQVSHLINAAQKDIVTIWKY